MSDFVVVWILLAVNSASPGPNVLNTVALAMGSGRRAGFGSAVGVGVGQALWCVATVLGLAALLRVLPQAGAVLDWVAAILLMLFSLHYLRSALRGYRARRMDLPGRLRGVGAAVGFQRALAVILVNPKALTAWLGVLAVVPVEEIGGVGLATLAVGAGLACLAVHAVYTVVFSTGTALRFYLRAGWVLQAAAGILFAGFALRLVAGA